MQREYVLFLKDMLSCAQKVQRYNLHLDYEAFVNNELVVDATLRNLEVVGEAAKNVPQDIRDSYPNVPWRAMARFRDVVAHHYFGVKLETVWDVVQNEIPLLLTELEAMLALEEKKRLE